MDPRYSFPGFREAHLAVCGIVHEIDKTPYHRIPQLRAAAEAGDVEASKLLLRYEDALAARKATTKGAK